MKDVKGVGMYDVKNTFSFYGNLNDGKNTPNWMTDVNDDREKYGLGIYNNDLTLVGNILLPFLLRGGPWSSGSSAGVFASYGVNGNAGYSCACNVLKVKY